MNADLSAVIETLNARISEEIRGYAASRKKDVARGAETPELAALLVEKYGSGLAKAAGFVADLLDAPASDLLTDVNRLVLEIDPKAAENRDRRWQARPVGLTFG